MSTLKKTAAVVLTAATLVSGLATTSSTAEARGWGGPFAGGLIGGLAAGAILGSAVRPAYGYGYGYGPAYSTPAYGYDPVPVYNPCYRGQTPVYDAYGNYAGFRTIRVCN